jgi:hypothetical protein
VDPYFDTSLHAAGVVAPLWAGTMALNRLVHTITADTRLALYGLREDIQRFWCSPERHWYDRTTEVVEIAFHSPKLINHIAFQMSRFPCEITVQGRREGVFGWEYFHAADHPRGTRIGWTITDSVPSQLPSIGTVGGHVHPQHSFAGHWQSIEFRTRPMRVTAIRLLLRRIEHGRYPRDFHHHYIPYSLALRHLTVGYRVSDISDVPYTPPDSDGKSTTFSSTTDLLGSPVTFRSRLDNPSAVLSSVSNSSGATWRCAPQPVPWAVVCFYLDLRDSLGNPQTIDRLEVDPLYEGPALNLYHSSDDPDAAFLPGHDPLPPEVAVVHDGTGIGGNVLASGDRGIGKIAFVDVDNAGVGFDPAHPWWFGATFTLKYVHDHTERSGHPLLDAGCVTLDLTPFGFRVQTAGGDTLNLTLGACGPTDPISILVAYDGKRTIQAWARVKREDYHGSLPLTVPLSPTSNLRFLGYYGDAPGVADLDVTRCVLKVDQMPDDGTVADFLINSAPYVQAGEFPDAEDPKLANALLRYDLVFSINPFPGVGDLHPPAVFLGGPPDRWAELRWSPIGRTYTLRKGVLKFDPVKSKYIKMEFTGMVPESYDVYQPVSRKVQTIPGHVVVTPSSQTVVDVDLLAPGTTASWLVNLIVSAFRFTGGILPFVGTGGLLGKFYTATTVRVLSNLSAWLSMAEHSWLWRFLPFCSPTQAPRFTQVGKHVYETIEIQQDTKVSYFVGLRYVAASRVDHASQADTEQYVELLHDDAALAAGNWIHEADHSLSSGRSEFAQQTSVVHSSHRLVTACQFAASQSAPRQVLPDDGFDDPKHANWATVGKAVFAPVTSDQHFESILRVVRNSHEITVTDVEHHVERHRPPLVTWESVIERYPTYTDASDDTATWKSMMLGEWIYTEYTTTSQHQEINSPEGGVTSGSFTPPRGGSILATTRVVAPDGLIAPLEIQIVDDLSGHVLAATEQTPTAGTVSEFRTTYELAPRKPIPTRWDDLATSPYHPSITDSFARADGETLGTAQSGQIWNYHIDANGIAHSLRIENQQAVAVASGETNTLSTGTPWGSLEVAVGSMGTPDADGDEMWLIRLGTMALDPGGRLIDLDGSTFSAPDDNVLDPSQAAQPVQAGDVIRIDAVPTVYLPEDRPDVTRPHDDPVVWPYALIFYRNGTWTRTVVHDRGAGSIIGIRGFSGQRFTSVTFYPVPYGIPGFDTVMGAPTGRNGGYAVSTPGEQPGPAGRRWVDDVGNYWTATGQWDTDEVSSPEGRDDVGAPLQATQNASTFTLDVQTFYGTLSAFCEVLESEEQPDDSGDTGDGIDPAEDLLVLDDINDIRLGTDGHVRVAEADYGEFVPDLATTVPGHVLSVQWVRTERLSLHALGGIDPAERSTMLLAKIDENIVGRFTHPNLDRDWRGTRRGLAGDVGTTFHSFTWAPDASVVPIDGTNPSWQSITQVEQATYDTVMYEEPPLGPVRAQLVQKGPSLDVFDVDALSLFIDPIKWELSRDGGYNFYDASAVRNNPHGVLKFPENEPLTSPHQVAGNGLVWRVTSYAEGSHVSSLVLRPWYAEILSGISHSVGIGTHGPNVMPFDHVPPIEKDARFRVWSDPVPQDWYFRYKSLSKSQGSS